MNNTLFGQCRIVRPLGSGGMGEVFEAQHTTLDERYALKLLPEDFASRPEAVERFRREAQVMASLEHTNIVRFYEFGETQGRYWLRMELVQMELAHGGAPEVMTLEQYAAKHGGKIEQGEFALILNQILEGLAHAHGKGVVHRDLKPGNILLKKDGNGGLLVKISDFGLAQGIGEMPPQGKELSVGEMQAIEQEEDTGKTALLGTWEYMAPEQRLRAETDSRSDVYAIGLICYRLLTGQKLGLEMPSPLVTGLIPSWDDFLKKALEQKPEARYANGGEMLSAFKAIATQVPPPNEAAEAATPPADKTDPKPPIVDTPRRRYWGMAAVMAVVTAGVLLMMGAWYFEMRTPEVKSQAVPPKIEAPPKIKARDKAKNDAKEKARLAAEAEMARKAHPLASGERWTNGVGEVFAPVTEVDVLFGIWDVRVQDYRAYANAVVGVNTNWQSPGFKQGDTHPVVNVSWEDAQAYCKWLTGKERKEGRISANQEYRLPTDAEWSVAVGLNESSGGTPQEMDQKIAGYPWGSNWPPTKGVGNYSESFNVDDYDYTSPVGSFKANQFGLYDMGGNVWQWCEDWWNADHQSRVLRGASWESDISGYLLSSGRDCYSPGVRSGSIGFRVVLVGVPAR